MISVIVCSRLPATENLHERNCRKTASSPLQYLRIDNQDKKYNLCSAYNAGVAAASGDILVFMHEDAFFMEGSWDKVLEQKFADPAIGLIGVAGTQYLFANQAGWVAAGRPYIRGKVIHETDHGKNFHLTVFSWEQTDIEVVAVDGLFFAVRKSLFESIKFDESTFDGFHLYDLDLCMQVRATHQCMVTPDIAIKHLSGGSFDAAWQKYAARFLTKWQARLPATCANTVPDPAKFITFENFDLKGKVGQTTIA